MKILKRLLVVAVIAFALFYVVMHPQDAANAVHSAVAMVWGAGEAVVHFFTSLAGS